MGVNSLFFESSLFKFGINKIINEIKYSVETINHAHFYMVNEKTSVKIS